MPPAFKLKSHSHMVRVCESRMMQARESNATPNSNVVAYKKMQRNMQQLNISLPDGAGDIHIP